MKKRKILHFIFAKLLPVLVPIVVIFTFNVLTPFWYDDFIMACHFDYWNAPHTQLLSDFHDIVISTINIYKTHHGRAMVDFVNFLFMFLKDKMVFNIANTIVYCIFIFLMCFHITGSIKKIHPLLFLCLNILVWLFLLAWGQNILWLTGSLNYLWTGTAILLFLMPFRKRAVEPDYLPPLGISTLWLFAGILAGWSIENSASGALVFLIGYFALKYKRRERAVFFEVTGAIGMLLGFSMLIGGGLFIGEGDGDGKGIVFNGLSIIGNIYKAITQFIYKDLVLLGIIAIISIEIIYFQKKKIPIEALLFFAAALGSVVAMIVPGYFRDRASFITQIFLIITAVSIFLEMVKYMPKRFIIFSYVCLAVVFVPSFYNSLDSIIDGYFFSKAREMYILSEKEKGNLNVKIKTPLPVKDSHSGLYRGTDILTDDSVRVSSLVHNRAKQILYNSNYISYNSAKATWYGLESLKGEVPKGPVVGQDIDGSIYSINYYLKHKKKDNLTSKDLYRIIYENW
ncbi:MAG: DUF6056 family protein [Fibromonadaceae bacterium]|nr:DUF6056 family protein [Fibromonadaceae bacterium]